MFKIRSAQNNDTRTVIAVLLAVMIIGVAAVNLAVTVPGLIRIFSPMPKVSQSGLIDTQAVRSALDVVGDTVH